MQRAIFGLLTAAITVSANYQLPAVPRSIPEGCVRRVRVRRAAVVFLVLARMVWAETPPVPEAFETTLRAVVYLRVERVYKHRRYQSFASGAFIHSQGYVLTNWSVVADEMTLESSGEERRVRATVMKVTAVVDSGSTTERELPATIVAHDRKRGLALLQVNYRPEAIVEVVGEEGTGIGDGVWIAGFGCRRLMAIGPKIFEGDMANPNVAISSGSVSSLEASTQGELMLLQLETAPGSGFCGGSIINENGHLVGLVDAGRSVCRERCFGVPPDRVAGFTQHHAVKTSLTPPLVLDPPQPIQVSVEPFLAGLESADGEVLFEGDDIEPVRYRLEPTSRGLGTSIVFPDRIPDRPRPPNYFVTVTLNSKDLGGPISQRFALDAVPDSLNSFDSARIPDEGEEIEGPPAYPREALNLSSDQGGSEGDSLSDLARSMKLRKGSSGSAVIDNSVVGEVGGASSTTQDHRAQRYELIRDSNLKRIVQEYDRLAEEIDRLNREQQESLDGSIIEQLEYGMNPSDEVRVLMIRKQELARRMAKSGVRWCGEIEVYFVADNDPSDDPCQGFILTM